MIRGDHNKMKPRTRIGFMAGFVTAVGLLVAVAVTAFAGSKSESATTRTSAAAPPIADAIGALRSPRAQADSLPAQAAAVVASLAADVPTGAGNDPGVLQLSASRRLLANVGAAGVDLFVVPTSIGKVCYVITGGPTGCYDQFSNGPLVYGEYDPDALGSGTPISLYGLARGDVTAVFAVVAGKREPATLGRNAFFYSTRGSAYPTAVVAQLRSGGEVVYDLAPPPHA